MDHLSGSSFRRERIVADYSFKPVWWASVLFATGFTLFVALAVWQLGRAQEKRVLIELQQQHQREPPVRLVDGGKIDPWVMRYRPVELEGDYDVNHQFLVDNQLHKQQPGYHVLTPLRLANGDAVLINRGWVPLGHDRTERPDLGISQPHVRLTGTVDLFYRVGFRLRGAGIPGPGWPSLLLTPESGPISERLAYTVSPYQVLLSPAADDGYVREWHEVTLDPGKNQGYALQWFLFALGALILYVRHALKNGAHHSS